MTATAELIRAYLEWQSEMGSDEVILSQPPVKKTAAKAERASGDGPMQPGRESAGAGIHRGDEKASPPGKDSRRAAPPFTGADTSAENAAVAGLMESLNKALEKSSDTRRWADPAAAGSGRGTTLRPSEAVNLPAFTDLEGFWTHMEGNPGLLQGEMPGMASGSEAMPPSTSVAGTGGTVTRVIRGTGPVKAPLALLGFEPGAADIAEGRPFRGDAGALLEKMMRAIRLEMPALYLSSFIKIPAPGKAWSRRELTRILPLLHLELGLAQVPMVLLLGQECAQTVLKTGKTLDELRQETHRMEGREFFVTYHPMELLRKEELKRKAWEDLQWLQRRMAEAQARP